MSEYDTWYDATVLGSNYEQQTNGVSWRHRPLYLARDSDVGFMSVRGSSRRPQFVGRGEWRPGPAPDANKGTKT